eukprot:TRINITY_DN10723_c0_g1_i1.p1 TRINITY_DN10723_c0_g1~~TRINITY_DN10723_c0_g1_i1.p1  ORF type:complete len:398 (+),score=51.84 TRINITY_DN10723_c0_g1_i1:45-1196(+)
MKSLVYLLLLSGVLVQAGTPGTKFVNCKTLGSEKCFYTKMESATVKVGNQGTNDDVIMEVCSDFKKTDCCKTPALKGSFSDDWSKDDTETWGKSYFGKCKDKLFLVKKALVVTLSKNGKGPLNVTSLVIDTQGEKKDKEPERFRCKGFYLGGTNLKQTQTCPTGPYEFLRFNNATVNIGPDGTDDSVKLKICSDANDVCCEHKLSHTLRDDWHVNKTEVWKGKDLGNCGKILYKVNNKPTVSVTKNGKDDLNVKDVHITMMTNDDKPQIHKYECGGFKLQGNCKTASLCRHTFSCRETGGSKIPPPPPLPPKRPSSNRPGSNRNTPRPNPNTPRPSSNRGGSGSGGKLSFADAAKGVLKTSTLPPGIPSGFQKLDTPFRSTSG